MNIPDVHDFTYKGHNFLILVSSGHPDSFPGCYWRLYRVQFDSDKHVRTNIVRYGETRGWDGAGAGSALSATKLARAAARRWVNRELRKRECA